MHFASLDAVRGLAALSVAVPHFFLFRGTESDALEFISIMAVEVFFVLSGVVLAPQLRHCIATGRFREVRTFYLRRWMRTLPPYFFVLAAMGILTGSLLSLDTLAYAFFVRNFVTVRDAGDYFMVAWSLAIEEWFYFVFPVFLIYVTRRASPVKAGLIFLAVLLLVKLFYAVLFPDAFADGRRIVVLRVDTIAFGFLLSLYLTRIPVAWAAVAAAISLPLSIYGMTAKSVFLFVYAAPVFAACLIVLMTAAERQLRRIKEPASFFAKTSYMVYLAHTPLIILIARLTYNEAAYNEAALFAAYLAILLGFCWAFHVSVEAPILRARPRYA